MAFKSTTNISTGGLGNLNGNMFSPLQNVIDKRKDRQADNMKMLIDQKNNQNRINAMLGAEERQRAANQSLYDYKLKHPTLVDQANLESARTNTAIAKKNALLAQGKIDAQNRKFALEDDALAINNALGQDKYQYEDSKAKQYWDNFKPESVDSLKPGSKEYNQHFAKMEEFGKLLSKKGNEDLVSGEAYDKVNKIDTLDALKMIRDSGKYKNNTALGSLIADHSAKKRVSDEKLKADILKQIELKESAKVNAISAANDDSGKTSRSKFIDKLYSINENKDGTALGKKEREALIAEYDSKFGANNTDMSKITSEYDNQIKALQEKYQTQGVKKKDIADSRIRSLFGQANASDVSGVKSDAEIKKINADSKSKPNSPKTEEEKINDRIALLKKMNKKSSETDNSSQRRQLENIREKEIYDLITKRRKLREASKKEINDNIAIGRARRQDVIDSLPNQGNPFYITQYVKNNKPSQSDVIEKLRTQYNARISAGTNPGSWGNFLETQRLLGNIK